MMHFKSDLGEITVSNAVFSNIAGMAATNCYGVKGMAFRSMTDGLVHLLRREAMSKGISVTYHEDNTISIELHIIVENGVNLPAVCKAIIDRLPEKQRTAMQLRDFEGKTYREIALIMGVSEDQVKINIFRARQTIKKEFIEKENYGL